LVMVKGIFNVTRSTGFNVIWDEGWIMADDFKVLILPGNLNHTPHNEDLVLLITKEEFLRMWKRGQAMIRNRKLKGRTIDGYYIAGSPEIS